MRDTNGFDRPALAPPVFMQTYLPPNALEGVRTRRMIALLLDLVLVSILSFAAWFGLAVLTLGLSIMILPPLFPLIAFFYNGLTISGWRMATPGMQTMDLEMRLTDGRRTPFLNAAAHAVLFYISSLFPPVFLVSLVNDSKRCVHDILAGVIITRRPV
ncbi:RDD family protein [Methylocapsa palsarum]|uniref:Uncharacterized membrane protein YckC, RDD family n=1 Tax=Methylocapsa palsarum TaxID=1612308 RepID=A0A1I4AF56_9HYPH|nr:RDD family protein [Methylocapsa palsarum]SFK54359.1 Uncharacterized membrane protein YckC, RDD family [Methylocapsa palsarum]